MLDGGFVVDDEIAVPSEEQDQGDSEREREREARHLRHGPHYEPVLVSCPLAASTRARGSRCFRASHSRPLASVRVFAHGVDSVRSEYSKRVHACARHVQQKKEEGLVVAVAHAVVDPHAVVVHAQHALVAHAAVVRARGLVPRTLLAIPRPAKGKSRGHAMPRHATSRANQRMRAEQTQTRGSHES